MVAIGTIENYKKTKTMNEAQTRFNKIDPKLRDAGWGFILVEQSAYIALGRIILF